MARKSVNEIQKELPKKDKERANNPACAMNRCVFINNIGDPGSRHPPSADKAKYIFVAMEPMIPAGTTCDEFKKLCELGLPNFLWGRNDVVIHYCLQKLLSEELRWGSDYYMTDLARGAMLGDCAKVNRQQRFEHWWNYVEHDIRTKKSDNPIVFSFGHAVYTYLEKKGHESIRLLHYSDRNDAYFAKSILDENDGCKYEKWIEDNGGKECIAEELENFKNELFDIHLLKSAEEETRGKLGSVSFTLNKNSKPNERDQQEKQIRKSIRRLFVYQRDIQKIINQQTKPK